MCFTRFSTIEELQIHIRDAHEWCGLQCSSEGGCQHSVMPNAETIGHEEVVQPDFDTTGLLQVRTYYVILNETRESTLICTYTR